MDVTSNRIVYKLVTSPIKDLLSAGYGPRSSQSACESGSQGSGTTFTSVPGATALLLLRLFGAESCPATTAPCGILRNAEPDSGQKETGTDGEDEGLSDCRCERHFFFEGDENLPA